MERANVAVSSGPLGTVGGVQLAAVFQSSVAGLAFQVALPAKVLLAVKRTSVRIAAAEGRSPMFFDDIYGLHRFSLRFRLSCCSLSISLIGSLVLKVTFVW